MLQRIAHGFVVAGMLGFAGFANGTILPENDLHLQDSLHSKSANITEDVFGAIIDRGMTLYKDVVADHGGQLVMHKLWENSTVNAGAIQLLDGTWNVKMYGGLARRPELTPDGFTLALCHELGHHLGGFPFVHSWAANEGQADYFATQSCARKFWKDDLAANEAARRVVDASAKATCDDSWGTVQERNLCYRTAMAGKSLAQLLSNLGPATEVQFDTPDETEVEETNNRHPKGQCRLDTFFAGSLCDVDFAFDVIPGKDAEDGTSSAAAENESRLYSCNRAAGHTVGVRPLCWFKPRI